MLNKIRMKLRSLLIGTVFTLFLAACIGQKSDVTTTPGAPFTLKIGQSATIDGLKLELLNIASDSRCPAGATCVWAGMTVAEFAVTTENTGKYAIFLGNIGGKPVRINSDDFSTYMLDPLTMVDGYELALTEVKPAKTQNEIRQSDYQLTLVVKKL